MAKYFERIIDLQTGEETTRDYTVEEIAEIEMEMIEANKRTAEYETKLEIRASALAKLAALGLTESEIAAL